MKKLMLVLICIAVCCFCSCKSSDDTNRETTKQTTKETYDYMSDDEKIEFFSELELPDEYEIENFHFARDGYKKDAVVIYAKIIMTGENVASMIEESGYYVCEDYPNVRNDDVSWWDLKEEDIVNAYSLLYSPHSESMKKTAVTYIYECEGKIFLECFG